MQRALELVIALTLLTEPIETAQQGAAHNTSTIEGEKSPNSEEDAESYEVYSTALKVKEPAVLEWAIVRETRAFQMCLEPARDQESIYRPMIDDYALKNKKTLILQRKFKLSAYTLVGKEAWASPQSIARDPARNTQKTTLAVFSAVGFNRDRTRALLCLWANTSGTCYFMAKKEGTWQIDRSWHGSGCGWAA